MTIAQYARKRIDTVLCLILTMKDDEFPYRDSLLALEKLESFFQTLRQDIENAEKSDEEMLKATCSRTLDELFNLIPVLGFIRRSTNVRNAFEVHGPLRRMARRLLRNEILLVISSEWDYSPYTFKPIQQLFDFALIGLPATESSNPLILPLAGHELGHHIWFNRHLATSVIQMMIDSAHGQLSTSDNSIAVDWAIHQAEESFCDFVGLLLFGTSFLHSSAYLIAPGQSNWGAPYYPNLHVRFKNLELAAQTYGIPVPDGFAQMASEFALPWSESEQSQLLGLVALADQALEDNLVRLIDLAQTIIEETGIELPTLQAAERIVGREFSFAVPIQERAGLANVLNAGWTMFLSKNLWPEKKNLRDKEDCLKQLILKSIEVLEVKERRNEHEKTKIGAQT